VRVWPFAADWPGKNVAATYLPEQRWFIQSISNQFASRRKREKGEICLVSAGPAEAWCVEVIVRCLFTRSELVEQPGYAFTAATLAAISVLGQDRHADSAPVSPVKEYDALQKPSSSLLKITLSMSGMQS
jgi:hypothetical protein